MRIVKFLNYIFPIIIGAICSSLGTWLDIESSNLLQIILIIIFSIIFAVLLYIDAKNDLETYVCLENKGVEINFLLIKNIILQLVAIAIGALCSSLGNWNREQEGFIIKVSFIVIISIFYVLFIIYSIFLEEKRAKENDQRVERLEQLNCIYNSVLESIVNISRTTLYDLKYIKKGNGKEKVGYIEKMANVLCEQLYKIIAQYDLGDFHVIYSKKIDNKFIRTIGYAASHGRCIPWHYAKDRRIEKDRAMDSIIMKTKPEEMIIYYNEEEINKKFYIHDTRERKYQMYFAIPVWNQKEIQGVFQVLYFTESTFFNNKQILNEFLKNIFPQYINITVLINELYESYADING